jgi:hypothetical protein
LAVLLNAFGLSLRKTSGFFRVLSEPLSKSSVEEWARRVEVKLSFDLKPREYSIIAVDKSVVKFGLVDNHYTSGLGWTLRQENPSVWFGVSLTRASHEERAEVSTQTEKEVPM